MPSLPRGGGEELAREEQVSSRKVSFLFQWYTANIFRWFVSEYCGFLHRDNLKTTWTSCLKCQCIETTMQQYVYIWIMYNISVGMLFFTCINKSFFSSIDGIYWCESAVLHSWFGTKRLVRALCLLAKNVLIIIYKYILAFFYFFCNWSLMFCAVSLPGRVWFSKGQGVTVFLDWTAVATAKCATAGPNGQCSVFHSQIAYDHKSPWLKMKKDDFQGNPIL